MAFLVTKGDRGPLFVAQTALVIVVSGILANLTFNVIATALGAGYPYSNFLFLPDDRFADFFKLSFSYPGQPVHPVADHWGVSGLLEHAWADVTKYAGTPAQSFSRPAAADSAWADVAFANALDRSGRRFSGITDDCARCALCCGREAVAAWSGRAGPG